MFGLLNNNFTLVCECKVSVLYEVSAEFSKEHHLRNPAEPWGAVFSTFEDPSTSSLLRPLGAQNTSRHVFRVEALSAIHKTLETTAYCNPLGFGRGSA